MTLAPETLSERPLLKTITDLIDERHPILAGALFRGLDGDVAQELQKKLESHYRENPDKLLGVLESFAKHK